MAQFIDMPKLSDTMTVGTLAKWLKKEGDVVKSGQVLCEIETDKATMEVEAVDEGKVAKILVAEGTEGVKVNAVIAVLAEEGEDAASVKAPSADAAPKTEEKKEDAPKAEEKKAEEKKPETKKEEAKPEPAKAAAPAKSEDGARLKASPLAKRIAANKGIDLKALKGSGPHGRIIRADVEGVKAAPVAAPAPAKRPAPVAAPAARDGDAGDEQLQDTRLKHYSRTPLLAAEQGKMPPARLV